MSDVPAASSRQARDEGSGRRFRRPTASRGDVIALDRRRPGTSAQGEFVSIVGPSGCGKSTLFNCVAGPDAAVARGASCSTAREPERLLGRVGYMPQRDLLMPWRTVLDNCTLGLEMSGVSPPRRRAPGRATALPRFGLDGFEDRWPRKPVGRHAPARGAAAHVPGRTRRDAARRAVRRARRAHPQRRCRSGCSRCGSPTARRSCSSRTTSRRRSCLSDRVYVMSGRPAADGDVRRR